MLSAFKTMQINIFGFEREGDFILIIYTSYKCKRCRRETILILITEELQATVKEGRYISCSHCGSKHIVKEKVVDNLKEVMAERSYKRNSRGALIQK